jgi:hypothetical protein
MDAELELDKIMKKLNKKQQAIIVELFKELHDYKEENDELIELFVNEKCFAGIRDKVEAKYKRCKKSSSALIVDADSKARDI